MFCYILLSLSLLLHLMYEFVVLGFVRLSHHAVLSVFGQVCTGISGVQCGEAVA